MAQKDTTEMLSSLHGRLASVLTDLLDSGEASTADLNVIRQFLKDNQITSQPVEDTPFGDLSLILNAFSNMNAIFTVSSVDTVT